MEKSKVKLLAADNRLEELRNRSRLTQEEVSIITGYSIPTISRHENRTRSLSEEAIKKYASLYKVETHELFRLEQEEV
jgi:transcriptional regulator with XRE-family HTH domain